MAYEEIDIDQIQVRKDEILKNQIDNPNEMLDSEFELLCIKTEQFFKQINVIEAGICFCFGVYEFLLKEIIRKRI